MGGCSSTATRVGVDAGAGAAAGALVGGGAGAVVGAAGGALVGAFTGGGCDTSRAGIISATQDIISRAITTSVTGNSSQTVSSQSLTVKCNPTLTGGLKVYEDNASCTSCLSGVIDGWKQQHRLEKDLITQDGASAKVRTPIDQEYASIAERISNCGLSSCKACALNNVTQTSAISTSSIVKDGKQLKQSFSTNLRSNLKQTFNQNRDILTAAVSTFQNNDDLDSLTDTISNNIENQVTENFLTQVSSTVSNHQTIQVVSTGSTDVSFLDQNAVFDIVLQQVNAAQIVTKAFSKSTLDQFASVVNDDSTLNELGEFVSKSFKSTSTAIDNIAGRIFIGAIIGLGAVLLVVLSVFAYMYYKRNYSGDQPGENYVDVG